MEDEFIIPDRIEEFDIPDSYMPVIQMREERREKNKKEAINRMKYQYKKMIESHKLTERVLEMKDVSYILGISKTRAQQITTCSAGDKKWGLVGHYHGRNIIYFAKDLQIYIRQSKEKGVRKKLSYDEMINRLQRLLNARSPEELSH